MASLFRKPYMQFFTILVRKKNYLLQQAKSISIAVEVYAWCQSVLKSKISAILGSPHFFPFTNQKINKLWLFFSRMERFPKEIFDRLKKKMSKIVDFFFTIFLEHCAYSRWSNVEKGRRVWKAQSLEKKCHAVSCIYI